MATPQFSLTRASALACLILWMGVVTVEPGLARQAAGPFSIPNRTQRPPAPAAPPELPAEALDLRPLTLEVSGRSPGAGGSPPDAQHVTRTLDRVHVRMSAAREWLYTRNPLDPRRVSAVMIDHRQRLLVTHEESELRNAFGIRGWLDVLTLGFAVETLAGMEPTADSRVVDEIVFTHFTQRRATDAVAGVWWSQANLLPLEVTTRDTHPGAVRVAVRAIRPTVDQRLLEPPATRFPTYRESGYADWLEDRGKH